MNCLCILIYIKKKKKEREKLIIAGDVWDHTVMTPAMWPLQPKIVRLDQCICHFAFAHIQGKPLHFSSMITFKYKGLGLEINKFEIIAMCDLKP